MILYKYLPPERTDVLRSGLIRFTPPVLFNDPFESRPVLSSIDVTVMDRVSKRESAELGMPEELRLEILHWMKDPAKLKRATELMFEIAGSIVGALSLSEKRDNLLMWAHYTAQHSGFVLGFDTANEAWRRLEERRGDRRSEPQKVVYSKTRPNRMTTAELRIEDIYYTKSSEWEYEQEWRITRPLDKPDSFIKEGGIHLYEFPKEAATELILGCRSSDALRQEIENILAEPAYGSCAFLRAKVDDTQFRLNIVPIHEAEKSAPR